MLQDEVVQTMHAAARGSVNWVAIAAVPIVALGLSNLALAMSDAVPLVFFGTTEEYAAKRHGQHVIWLACALLVAAGLLLASTRSRVAGIAVAAAGIVCTFCVKASPDTALAWLPFVPLALLAGGATLVAAIAPPKSPAVPADLAGAAFALVSCVAVVVTIAVPPFAVVVLLAAVVASAVFVRDDLRAGVLASGEAPPDA